MRRLATIQKILDIRPIPGADMIEAIDILGWTVVAQKGIHTVGDLVIYYEVDSWLSADDPRYDSFKERFSNWGDKHGMRLKTIKLRKQISQGLIMSIKKFPEIQNPKEDDDVTELLKIEKWESLSESQGNGGGQGVHTKNAKPFPSFIRKTDQERIQNYLNKIPSFMDDTFEVTIKLDGSSMTVFHVTKDSPYFHTILVDAESRELRRKSWFGKLAYKLKKRFGFIPVPEYIQGVCSRNIQLDIDGDNHFSQYVKDEDILARLAILGKSIAIQGELVGPNIQNNYEAVDSNQYYIYDVFDIDKQEYLLPVDSHILAVKTDIDYVPVLSGKFDLKQLPGLTAGETDPRVISDAILRFAEGDGMNKGVKREGLVFKSNTNPTSFKAISNSYLIAKDKK